jgi:DNA-binding transcriptional LysR family regulator
MTRLRRATFQPISSPHEKPAPRTMVKKNVVATLLNAKQLLAIVTVSEAGSVHAASRILRLPQPQLSRLIASAERELGVELFNRSRSGTRSNPASERVVREASFALEALRAVSRAARERVSTIRLGCLPRVLHALGPRVLARIEDQTSRFRLQISVGNSEELTESFEEGRLDVVISRRVALTSGATSDVHAERLYSERTVVVCGYANRAVARRRAPIAKLTSLPWILPKRGSYSRDVMDAIVSLAGQTPVVPVIESNQFESSLWVVATSGFLSIAPELAARRLERLRLIRSVATTPSLGDSPLMLQYRRRQLSNPEFEEFVAAVRDAARNLRNFGN